MTVVWSVAGALLVIATVLGVVKVMEVRRLMRLPAKDGMGRWMA